MSARLWLMLTGSAVLLSGCGGGWCAGQAPPAIIVDVSAYGATGAELCDAQAVAYDSEGYVEYVEGVITSALAPEQGCRYTFAQLRFGTYTFELQVQDFEPLTIDNIEFADDHDSCSADTVAFTETLTRSSNVCHEGYEWVNDACHTPNGCEFPRFEQQVIPGVQGGEISYECVNTCESPGGGNYVLPEAPGRCKALALP